MCAFNAWYMPDGKKRKKSNTKVLQICNITGIEGFLITAQLRWTGHVLRVGDNRLPRPSSAVNRRKAHVLAVDSGSDTRTR